MCLKKYLCVTKSVLYIHNFRSLNVNSKISIFSFPYKYVHRTSANAAKMV